MFATKEETLLHYTNSLSMLVSDVADDPSDCKLPPREPLLSFFSFFNVPFDGPVLVIIVAVKFCESRRENEFLGSETFRVVV